MKTNSNMYTKLAVRIKLIVFGIIINQSQGIKYFQIVSNDILTFNVVIVGEFYIIIK